MDELAMDGPVTPAAELASEAAGFNLSTPENMMQSYDQDYEAQVASIEDRMQRYHVLSIGLATPANP
jgi:hypothetical protein